MTKNRIIGARRKDPEPNSREDTPPLSHFLFPFIFLFLEENGKTLLSSRRPHKKLMSGWKDDRFLGPSLQLPQGLHGHLRFASEARRHRQRSDEGKQAPEGRGTDEEVVDDALWRTVLEERMHVQGTQRTGFPRLRVAGSGVYFVRRHPRTVHFSQRHPGSKRAVKTEIMLRKQESDHFQRGPVPETSHKVWLFPRLAANREFRMCIHRQVPVRTTSRQRADCGTGNLR